MEELRRCIVAAMEPRTDPASRDAANRQLYALQNDPNSVMVCIEGFSHPDRIEPSLLSFLMNVAKTQVVLFHERWPKDVRHSFRETVFKCFTLPAFAQPRTSEKMAQILVEIAIREWPQLWPNVFDLVYGLLPSKPHLALGFLSSFISALRSEVGDAHVGGWSGERKAEVTSAFNEVLPELSQWLHSQTFDCSDPMAIRLYGQLCGWARLEQHERLVDWCLELVRVDGPVGEEAIEALLELPNRTFHSTNAEDDKLVDYLMGKGLKKFNQLLEVSVGANYLLFRQLIDVVTALISKLSGEKADHLRIRIQSAVLDLQLYLSHPSLYVRSALVMCILDVFRGCDPCSEPTQQWLDETVEQAIPLLTAILAEDPMKTFRTPDNQTDFDEFAEYLKVFEHLKSRIGDLVGRMARASAATFTRIIDSQSSKLLGAASSKWQTAILFLVQHGFSEGMPDGFDLLLEGITGRVVGLLQSATTTTSYTDFKLIEEALYALRSLCFASSDPQVFKECYKVFAHFALMPAEGALQVRCRSMACLYQMAATRPEAFLHSMPSFLSLASGVKGQRELRSWIETVILMAGHEGFPVDARMQFFKAVFVPLLAQIESSSARYITDGQGFAEYIGIQWYLASERVGPEPEEAKNSRVALVNTLTLIQATARGLKGKRVDGAVSDVVLNVFIPVLLNVLFLVASVQSIFANHPNYSSVFTEHHKQHEEDDEEDTEKQHFRYMNNWISHVRTVAYTSLGYLSDHPFDHSKMLIGFDRIKCSDRISLVRCALLPIFKSCQSDRQLIETIALPIVSFCKVDFQSPVYFDADDKQASDWLSTFVSLLTDCVFKSAKCKNVALFSSTIDIVVLCVINSAPPQIISKWASFVSDHIDPIVGVNDTGLFRKVFCDLCTVLLDSLTRRAATHQQALSMLVDIFRANAGSGLYEVDRLLCTHAKVPSSEVDRLRAMFSGRDRSSRSLKAALSASLQPLMRQARPVEQSTVRKLAPDKLIILSKLRRAAEQEELENRAVSDAAHLFD